MRSPMLAALALVGGCVDSLPPPSPLDAHDRFTQAAWPVLGACVGCHGAQPAIDFLAPATADGAYATVMAFQPPVVNLESPAASLLLTMGKHTGPPLDPTAAPTVLDWIQQEQKERMPTTGESPHVGPVALTVGTKMSLDLPGGGKLAFVPGAADGGLELAELAITAGAQGLHVTHPLFVDEPMRLPAVIDQIDRFADVDSILAANDVLALGGGDALFLDFDPSTPLAIHFRTLEVP
jgi:hypothetical protein